MVKLKNRIVYEFMSMREQLHLAEYLSWWALRIAMIITYIVFTVKEEQLYQRNLILLNTALTFVIPLLRFISPRKLFTSKISFRIQTYVNVFIFMGSFLGHGFKFLGEVPEYDKFMHFVSGGFAVFIGAELLKAFKGYEKVNAAIKTLAGTGFSFIVMVMWEMIEFFADWFITSSTNQGYNIVPDETMLFVKIFGLSKNHIAQAPVYDTNADIFYAVIGCGICALILYVILSRKEKKAEAESKESVKA